MLRLTKILLLPIFCLGITVWLLVLFYGFNISIAAESGSLIKIKSLPSVYYLGDDGNRYAFPNETTYFSWYSDFSTVITISDNEMASYPLKDNITIRPGTKLIKITTDPKVYAVEPGGELRWIESEEIAKKLYGDSWSKRVVDVPDSFINSYKVNGKNYTEKTEADVKITKLSGDSYPIGSIIKYQNSSTVYYIDNDNKAKKIDNASAFTDNQFKSENIITASKSIIHSINNISISKSEKTLIDAANTVSSNIISKDSSATQSLISTPSTTSGGGGGGGTPSTPTSSPSSSTDACESNSDCNDAISSTQDICSGTPKACSNTTITTCTNNDSYCPTSCSNANDNDCAQSYAVNNIYNIPVLVLSYFPTTPCYSTNLADEINLSGATASSNRASSNPQNAIDGAVTSGKWAFASEPYQDQYLLVDIGGLQSIGAISFYYWSTDRPESYYVDVSATGLFVGEEVRVVTETDGLSGYVSSEEHASIQKKNYPFNAVSARYIKLTVDDYRNSQSPDVGQLNLYELKIYSSSEQKNCLDQDVTGDVGITSSPDAADPLSSIRNRVSSHTQEVINALNEGSKYHGYKDASATAALNYSVYQSIEYTEAIPESATFSSRADYMQILNDLNICNYVDNLGIKQVWMWGYHHGNIAPEESSMAMGTLSQNAWNMSQSYPNNKLKVKTGASWGNISNSGQTQDMPVCEHTYVLINPVYSPSSSNAIHNHLHQFENTFAFAGGNDYCLGGFVNGQCVNSSHTPNMFWDRFGGKWYNTEQGSWICGNAHFPPNVTADYNYNSTATVLTSCPNWQPDGSGTKESISCNDWDCDTEDYYIWWMQNIPGKGNDLEFESNKLKNWWDFIGDFDSAIAVGKNLIY
ncbi:MAG: discoidin domain-containing protein [Patescibacteria group bacterium]